MDEIYERLFTRKLYYLNNDFKTYTVEGNTRE